MEPVSGVEPGPGFRRDAFTQSVLKLASRRQNPPGKSSEAHIDSMVRLNTRTLARQQQAVLNRGQTPGLAS
jgi:hypothetical protein